MSDGIARWLEEMGLGQYAQAFADNAIDLEVLPDVTAADLDRLGVLLGHQKKMLRGIAALNKDAASPIDAVPQATGAAPSSVEAERRQLTVMFCDLVGSTALSARLDPEDLREVLRGYQEAVAAIVGRYDGHIAQYLGDGVVAYFGWPRAHEDDAERAVRAGLAVTEAVARRWTPAGDQLAARVGIATGVVVVGDLMGEGVSNEEAVVGETPNLAARLQTLAEPGKVVVAQATRRLLGETFVYEDLGVHPIKGIAEPVRAWQVVGEGVLKADLRRYTAHG